MLKDSQAKELQKGDDVLIRGKITDFVHGGIQIEIADAPGRVYWFESTHVERVEPEPVNEPAAIAPAPEEEKEEVTTSQHTS